MKDDGNLVLYNGVGGVGWSSQTATTDSISSVVIQSVTMHNTDTIPTSCSTGIATVTTLINKGTEDMTYDDTVSWSSTESHTSTYSTSFSSTLSAEYKTNFLAGEATFSAEISIGTSSEKSSTTEVEYEFSKAVSITVPPGKTGKVNLLGCVIDNYPISFDAVVQFNMKSGATYNKTISGTWSGTTYSSYTIQLTEFANS